MPFEKVKTKKKSAFIIEQIVDAIKSGEYDPGEKLPSEREIAESMGVSRPSIREAFSALQVAGVIESRSGDGTYVQDASNWAIMEKQALGVLEEGEDPYAIWAARKGIEYGIAKIAVNNATKEDINMMESAIDSMKSAVNSEEYEKFFKADQDFHVLIGKATHNPYIENIIPSLVDVMEQELWQKINRSYYLEGGTDEGKLEDSLEHHKAILEAIKDHNAQKAERAIKSHFNELKEYME